MTLYDFFGVFEFMQTIYLIPENLQMVRKDVVGESRYGDSAPAQPMRHLRQFTLGIGADIDRGSFPHGILPQKHLFIACGFARRGRLRPERRLLACLLYTSRCV